MNDKKRKMIEYAFYKVPFYNQLYNDKYDAWAKHDYDMKLLPPVSKDMLIGDEEKLLSSDYYAKKNQENLISCRTSGSTGTCLMIQWDKSEYTKSLLPLWLERKKAAGILPWDRYCYFFTTSNYIEKEDIYVEQDRHGMGFSKSGLSEGSMCEIYEKMLEYNPVWLLLQPSIALLMCNMIRKYNMPKLPELRYIELSGEMLFPNIRSMIEETLQCTVRNQYGCNEVNSIAYECEYGNLHCINSNLDVEIIRENGETDDVEGEICVTAFCNHAMPFIRYRTGDIGSILKRVSCKCGNRNPVLKLTKGRLNDFIYSESGEKLTSYIFVHAIDMANIAYGECINQFQIIQTKINEFIIRVALDEEDMEQFEGISEVIAEHIDHPELKNACYSFECYTSLEIGVSGKLQYFSNCCNLENT